MQLQYPLQLAVSVVYYSFSTFPSKFSCCISWSLFPIPIKAQGCDSCSVQPSRSICSFFFFHPLPMRYTHGGGQKNLKMKNTLWSYTEFSRYTNWRVPNALTFTLCTWVYTGMPFICLEDFWKWKNGKSVIDALPLRIFPVQCMSGNSLHLCKTPYKGILKGRKKGLTSYYSLLQVLNLMEQLIHTEDFPKLI